jgi:stage V sporulation protein R
MTLFATNTGLPSYLRRQQERIETLAREYGLDFFPVVFEMLSYDQMNEVAAYAGFPNRYPHWRFGMEYEQLSKSYEYGLSKIYEMVINNTPAFAYLLEGNSLTDQKLVMCHVYAHVDFFKNNFAFRTTDLDSYGAIANPAGKRGADYTPDRKWVDKMANHGATVRRLVDRHGIDKVEDFIDTCLSLENLIDPWQRFVVRRRPAEDHEEPEAVEVPKLHAKDYMEHFINPEEYLAEQRRKLEAAREAERKRSLAQPERDVLEFLLERAPLERWERTLLTIVRDEAYYYLPQMQTKIMNEGWASYFHSKLMTERVCDWSEIVDYADDNAGVMSGGGGRLNPYKLGVELYRSIEDRWNKGQFGRDWENCDDLDVKRTWDLRLGLGRDKIFEVRALYTDVTFIDEFLTPEFARQHGLFTYGWSGRNERYEIASREFAVVKEKLLSRLTNSGSPIVAAVDGNYGNRGELLLVHEHHGVDLRPDYAEDTLGALARVWKRPVLLATEREGRAVVLTHDGTQATVRDGSP